MCSSLANSASCLSRKRRHFRRVRRQDVYAVSSQWCGCDALGTRVLAVLSGSICRSASRWGGGAARHVSVFDSPGAQDGSQTCATRGGDLGIDVSERVIITGVIFCVFLKNEV